MPRKNAKNVDYKWFRFSNQAIHNRKIQQLPPHVFKTWVNLLCLASQSGDGELPPNDEMAFQLRMTPQQVQTDIDHLIDSGLIDLDPDFKMTPHNWSKWQYKSDAGSAQRMRRHRARNRNVTSHVTERDVTSDDFPSVSVSGLVHPKDSTKLGGTSKNDLAKKKKWVRLDDDQGGEA